MEELNSGDAQQCVTCISRLKIIAMAMGADETRTQLLPYLKSEIKENKFTDEVQVTIADQLGKFVDFIGPKSEAHCLFDPLYCLCSGEESTVRDTAVISINAIANTLINLDAGIVVEFLVPKVLDLAAHSDWFTPRVSACGLIAVACKAVVAVGNSEKKAAIIKACKDLSSDDSPMVRRAAAAHLGNVADVLSQSEAANDLLPLYKAFLADDQDSVRVNALKGTGLLCKKLDTACKLEVLNREFNRCITDKSWRVRIACAEAIADVAKECTKPETSKALIKIYKDLQSDAEQEVRVATALRGAGASAALGCEFAAETVFPVVSKLCVDVNSASRVELSTVLMELAKPLGKEKALELVLPYIFVLTDAEEQTNVRLSVINQLGNFIETVGGEPLFAAPPSTTPNSDAQDYNTPIIHRLMDDKNWRVRHAILQLIPKLAEEYSKKNGGIEDLDAKLSTADESSWCKRYAMDPYALIRVDLIHVLSKVVPISGYGTRWLEAKCTPVFIKLLTYEANVPIPYQHRAVPLYALEFLPRHFDVTTLENKLIPNAVAMLEDKVPNLRLQVCKALEQVAKQKVVSKECFHKVIEASLQKHATDDEDVDVTSFANNAHKAFLS